MRAYHPDWDKYGISRERYKELRAFCHQYPEWRSEAASLLGIGAQKYGERVGGSGVSDPVARVAERREQLLRNAALVEAVAASIDGGRWYAALIQNVCLDRPLAYIDPAILPTSNRNAFYVARRRFYIALSEAKTEI